MPEPLDVLLIGGSGFMGRHAARALLAAGHRVTILARGRRRPVEGATALAAERGDPGSLARALAGRRFDLTVDFLVWDADDIERLWPLAGSGLGRYMMISTGQVYLVAEGARPPFREEDADRPLAAAPRPGIRDHAEWSYGAGKRRAEQALRRWSLRTGSPTLSLRLPIVQGEGDGSLRLWAYLERILDGGPLVLPEGGRQAVRFLHAGDLARALVCLAEAAPPGVAYNLAQPDVIPLAEFLDRVARAAGRRARFVEADWQECRAAGLDADFSPCAGGWVSVLDPGRAAAEWGFRGTPVDGYLPGVVRWHLEHRPPRSHVGYAQRQRELELASRLHGGGEVKRVSEETREAR